MAVKPATAQPSWVVNENTTMILRVSFFDEDGDPVVPSGAWYRIDEVKAGAKIVPPGGPSASASPSATEDPEGMVPFPTLASVVDIEVTAAQNKLVTQRLGTEERLVSVEFDYDGDKKHGSAEYRYWIKGLAKVT
jgi:hypothetical protein